MAEGRGKGSGKLEYLGRQEPVDAEWTEVGDETREQPKRPKGLDRHIDYLVEIAVVGALLVGVAILIEIAMQFTTSRPPYSASETNDTAGNSTPDAIGAPAVLPSTEAVRFEPSRTAAIPQKPHIPSSADRARDVELYSNDYWVCLEGANGGYAGIHACEADELESQDRILNRIYKILMLELTPPERTTLRQEERNWIAERDKSCERLAAPEKGGELFYIVHTGCILRATAERRAYLEQVHRDQA